MPRTRWSCGHSIKAEETSGSWPLGLLGVTRNGRLLGGACDLEDTNKLHLLDALLELVWASSTEFDFWPGLA